MSTRATIHFHQGSKDTNPDAIVYRHSDGYPEGLGKDLEVFFDEVAKKVNDTRFGDASYLAAKWVVWDATRHVKVSRKYGQNKEKPIHYLDFLGIGICQEDPGDIEYCYHVICTSAGKPEVIIEKV